MHQYNDHVMYLRLEGLLLLHQVLQQCTTEVFVQHAKTWSRLLLSILQVSNHSSRWP